MEQVWCMFLHELNIISRIQKLVQRDLRCTCVLYMYHRSYSSVSVTPSAKATPLSRPPFERLPRFSGMPCSCVHMHPDRVTLIRRPPVLQPTSIRLPRFQQRLGLLHRLHLGLLHLLLFSPASSPGSSSTISSSAGQPAAAVPVVSTGSATSECVECSRASSFFQACAFILLMSGRRSVPGLPYLA
jgi:hypothetical protein